MRIYLAGRYGRREEIRTASGYLRSLGHEVTSRWLDGLAEDESRATSRDFRRWAREDLSDIDRSECLIAFTEAGGCASRGGRHVEFGYALARGKRLIVVGIRENAFMHGLEMEQYENITELLVSLAKEGLSVGLCFERKVENDGTRSEGACESHVARG